MEFYHLTSQIVFRGIEVERTSMRTGTNKVGRPSIPYSQVKPVFDDIINGMSKSAAADKHGISREAVYDLAERYEVDLPPARNGGKPRIPEEIKKKIIALYADGKSCRDISNATEVSHQSVSRICKASEKKAMATHGQPKPPGAQYLVSGVTWYKIKNRVVFTWWNEAQEWVSTRGRTASEVRREGVRV